MLIPARGLTDGSNAGLAFAAVVVAITTLAHTVAVGASGTGFTHDVIDVDGLVYIILPAGQIVHAAGLVAPLVHTSQLAPDSPALHVYAQLGLYAPLPAFQLELVGLAGHGA